MTARLLLAVGLLAVGCYDVPKPDCGFRCDVNTGCPDGYTCASDGRCHRDGSDPSLVCPTPDAAPAYSPRIVSSNPRAGQIVDPASPLRVTFDIDVAGVSTLSFAVVVRSTQTLVSGIVSYDRDTQTAAWIAPDGLPPNTQLDMLLSADIFDPVTARPLMAQSIGFATSADVTSPQVDFVSPPNASIGAGVDSVVFLRFTEPVMNATTGTITLAGPGGAVPATVFYSVPGRSAELDPTAQLAPLASYTVTAGTGILDASGNPLVPFTSTFATGADAIRPQVLQTIPTPGATGVALGASVAVTFDEPVTGVTTSSFQLNSGAIAGAITMSSDGRTATFVPTAALPAASTIEVRLGTGIADLSTNALVPQTFSFATQ